MPWDKQFDVDEALDRAKDIFWEHGYGATSMEMLLKAMRINRGSFYDTFKSKRDVMIRTLRRYSADDRASVIRAVAAGKSPREAITAVFRGMIDGSRGSQGRHGCFLVNSALEVAPQDEEASQIVREGLRDVERFFAELIRAGQEKGEFPKQLDPTEMGRTLMNQMVGLMVLVRSKAPKSVQESVVNQVSTFLA
ncbi:MAG: TetR/AcrR family transcriptional regulator [Acidobacteria bacterium]|nr:TetR/AcrR family transcriptional regulator [Acidobacteriota bacterium]